MKTKLLALLLFAGSSLFAGTRVFFGVGVGAPGYTWVGGYWYPAGPRYNWHAGYWARPPYAGARWYAPRYYNHRYYPGYWRR